MWRTKLKSGREIRLNHVNFYSTYSGMLEGIPDKWLNDNTLKNSERDADKFLWGDHIPFHLIQPVRIEVKSDPPNQRLPGIRFVGMFDSEPLKGSDQCFSGLRIAWFQEEPWPPQGNLFEDLDWENLAMGWDP